MSMAIDQSTLKKLAEWFYQDFYHRSFPGDLAFPIKELSLDEAYQVQDQVAEMRIAQGEKVVGYKVGCTSKAIQEQFGLSEPICGRLFAPHFFTEDTELYYNQYTNCAIEPEMVLKIDKDLVGENLSYDELIAGIEYVSPGIEVHHYKFWFTPTTSQELICSNGIHAGLVVGSSKVSPKSLTFEKEIFEVFKDGLLITKGPASEILGGPLISLRWLVGCLTSKGQALKAGSYVIPGSPVELVPINEETVLKVSIEGVGSVATHLKKA